jgi:hypothetical protein
LRAAAVAVLATMLGAGGASAADVAGLCHAAADKVRQADPAALAKALDHPRDNLGSLAEPIPDVTLPAEQMHKIAALFSEAGTVNIEVQALGGGDYRASQLQGSMHCLEEHYVHFAANGAMTPRPGFKDPEDGLCWTSWRDAVQTAGGAALLSGDQLEQPQFGTDLTLTAWRGGLGPSCQVSIRARDAFVVSEHFCRGDPLCRPAVALAAGLAEAYVRGPYKPGQPDGPAQIGEPLTPAELSTYGSKLDAARKHFDGLSPNIALPTFGAQPRTSFPRYAAQWVTLAKVDGHVLVVVVGQGGVGWREIGDYLVGFYTPTSLTPVAGVVIKRRITGLASLKVRP